MLCQKSTYSLVLVILWFGIGEIQGGSRQEAGGSSRRCFLLSTKVSRLSDCFNKKDGEFMHNFTGNNFRYSEVYLWLALFLFSFPVDFFLVQKFSFLQWLISFTGLHLFAVSCQGSGKINKV